ncbi:protein-glutamine glutaminase family protein [Bdellovibrio svalbardensis]|uniref:Protein-glutamine glutaminase family protein n=1 Tax=Bdellovibrio svalbardensis TaxID=2972972 RepID=A0ABT6DMM8_9BACT|nr:protein-glutamine glutaminase family protein [Bdellovibrio svalbardensis]MDG0818126.1 protein-glutamine glutaminase family protein [Bdellovibrio svalbardensis]
MKFLKLAFLFLLGAIPAQADDLKSFAAGLDQTLRHVNRSGYSKPCSSEEFTTSSSRLGVYQGKKVTIVSEADAQKIFADLKNHSEIPYDFSFGGCEERAHEMSRLMMLKGITPLKGFASVDESKAPRLQIPHPTKKGEYIQWKYHVAPVILVAKNGELVPYTLDPSLAKKAIPTSEWLAEMTRHDPKMKVKMTFAPAMQYDVDGRIRINMTDKDFNQSIQDTLKDLKKKSQDPNGEAEYYFEKTRIEETVNMMDSGGY